MAVASGLDAARLLEANRTTWLRYWPQIEDDWTLGRMSGSAVTLEAWRRTLRASGRDDQSLADLARDVHLDHVANALRLYTDADELLDALAPDVALAVVTNGASDTQRAALAVAGIEPRFGAIVVSGEVGIAKPDPSIFAMALEMLGVSPEHAWHVGDSLRSDVAGALGAGLTAVWINRSGTPRAAADPNPDHEIRTLRELPDLLARTNREPR